jgi:hypothetical protein
MLSGNHTAVSIIPKAASAPKVYFSVHTFAARLPGPPLVRLLFGHRPGHVGLRLTGTWAGVVRRSCAPLPPRSVRPLRITVIPAAMLAPLPLFAPPDFAAGAAGATTAASGASRGRGATADLLPGLLALARKLVTDRVADAEATGAGGAPSGAAGAAAAAGAGRGEVAGDLLADVLAALRKLAANAAEAGCCSGGCGAPSPCEACRPPVRPPSARGRAQRRQQPLPSQGRRRLRRAQETHHRVLRPVGEL